MSTATLHVTPVTIDTIDALFTGEVVLGVPTTAAEYQRKMPGHSDAQGDHC